MNMKVVSQSFAATPRPTQHDSTKPMRRGVVHSSSSRNKLEATKSSVGKKVQKVMRWRLACELTGVVAVIFVADYTTFMDTTELGNRIQDFGRDINRSISTFDGVCLGSLAVFLLVQFLRCSYRANSSSAPASRGGDAPCAAACGKLTSQGHASTEGRKRAAGEAAAHQSEQRSVPSQCEASSSQANRSANTRVIQAIDQALRAGHIEKAGNILLEFERSGGKPDVFGYNLIIRAFAKRGDVLGTERWLSTMERSGVEATVCSYNTVLDACAKADNAEACEEWLRWMVDRGIDSNVISYATVIYAWARRGDVERAAGWLQNMIDAGIQPDVVSYNSLIHACGVRGLAMGAEHWVLEMKARGLEPTVTTYTAAIDACAKCGDLVRAEAWMEKMLEDGVEPNVVTFSALIDTCAKKADMIRAEYWHDKLLERDIKPNAHTYSAVISACAKSNNVNAAERWLKKSEDAGVVGDVVVYSAMIDACGKANDAERASRIFDRMLAAGIRPHIIAYAALARPFAYRGDWPKVEQIAATMAAEGTKPNEYFIYAQLLAYDMATPKQPERAEACFRSALQMGIKENDHVVGVLARVVGRPRSMELMQELCNGRPVQFAPRGRRQASALGSGGGTNGARRR
mmetsp:Transcript_70987/g.197191  ORF Transcript_70987/g.197191 Transcript_70987/m.197191 type:complete len:631 (-) Transcript_70987:90-1982(-)